MQGTFWLKLGLELRVCNPPGVGATVNQNRKWKSRFRGVEFITMSNCVNSIADLRALSPGAAPCLTLLGYYTPGDGGGGDFYWDPSATEADNVGTTIAPAPNPPPTGRWKRLVDGPLSVRWFGARANANYHNSINGQWCADSGLTLEAPDDAPAIVAAMKAAESLAAISAATVLIPAGSYYLKTPTMPTESSGHNDKAFFQPKSNVSIYGEDNSSILHVAPGLNFNLNFTPELHGFNVFYTDAAISNVAFRHITIDGNGKFNPNNPNYHRDLDPPDPDQVHNHLIGLTNQSTTDINIEFCRFENTNGWNPVLIGYDAGADMATNVRVTNCSFYEIGNDLTTTDHSSLWIQADGAVIANNIFFNEPDNNVSKNVGCAIELHGQNLVFIGNRIRNHCVGITLSIGLGLDTKNVSVSGNVFEDITGGISCWQAAGCAYTNQLLKNISVVGNVFSIRPNGNTESEYMVRMDGNNSGQIGVDALLIADNVCTYNTDTGWPDVSPMGIGWVGNIRSCTITGNRFGGFRDGAIVLSPQAMGDMSLGECAGDNLCWDVKIANNHFTECGTNPNFAVVLVTTDEAPAVVKRLDIQGNTFVYDYSLPRGRLNMPYVPYPKINPNAGLLYFTLQSQGVTGPFSWSAIGLPAGLALDVNGVLSGTPTEAGTFTPAITASDGSMPPLTVQQSYSLTIDGPLIANPLNIITYALPKGTVYAPPTPTPPFPNNTTLQAKGGTPPYTWSASGLPAGLALISAAEIGLLSGTPTDAGTFTPTITVSDGSASPLTVEQSYSLAINGPLSIITAALPRGTSNAPYVNLIMLAQGGSSSYTWSASGLPPGLVMSLSGVLSGTPIKAGSFTPIVKVSDQAIPLLTVQQSYSLAIDGPLSIITPTLPVGTSNSPYVNLTLLAQGGSGSYTWSASGLPPGMMMSPGGVLSGTPTQAGSFTPTISISDNSMPLTAQQSYSLSITGPLSITISTLSTGTLPTGTWDVPYPNFTLLAQGGSGSYTWSASGLPPSTGLKLSGDGVLSGTSSLVGSFNPIIKVSDSSTPPLTAQQSYSLTFLSSPTGGPPSIITLALPKGTWNVPYPNTGLPDFTLQALGGTTPYSWSAIGLPAGLSLSNSGVLSGSPIETGSFNPTITLSDSSTPFSLMAQTSIPLTIAGPLSINTIRGVWLKGSAVDGARITENAYRNITTPMLITTPLLLPPGITNVEADFDASITVTPGSFTAPLGTSASRVLTTTVKVQGATPISTLKVQGATSNSYVTVVPPSQQSGLLFSGMVLPDDTAVIAATNASAGSISPPAGTYTLQVRRIF
jgi:hypothetical protein